MTRSTHQSDEAGFALVLTILVVIIVGSLVAGAAFIGQNHLTVNRFYDRQSDLEMVADAGLEWARSKLNGNDAFYPDTGFVMLENGAEVTDGKGVTMPGVKRWIYVGPSGVTSGQYGVFGTILSVAEDDGGGRVIRREQIYQESFSKYAYFTDIEPSNISFGGGDQIFGPVHTNDKVKIYSSGATFHGLVRTAKYVTTPQYGTFKQGYEEYVSPIAMPATAELSKLKAQAAAGNTSITGNSNGNYGEATTRIEFMAIDLNGDGDGNDSDEGFFRVYQSTDAQYVTGRAGGVTTCSGPWWNRVCTTTGGVDASDQCGAWYNGTFVSTNDHPYNGTSADDALRSATGRCYLGGSDSIFGGFQATDSYGGWVQYGGTTPPAVSGRPDANYLFPISRRNNPNFKGVIYVEGKVVVSGKIRGRVTIAASDDIIFGDDITYVTDPGAGTCVDIAGYFAGDQVIVADNALNAPQYVVNNHYTLDDTSDEFFHGTVLALNIFTVHNYSSGSKNDEPCEGASNGRGCLYLTGGIIQNTRGAVGTTSGTGYVKRYSYDTCGATNPPPYFPTTGYFAKGQYYQVDPDGFTPTAFFDMMTPG
jgi:hypothetical protein